MEMHQARHASDSAAIMTVVLSANGGDATAATASSPIQLAKDDLVVAYDESHQDRVLLYDNHSNTKSVNLPCSFFVAHPGMTVRTDLSDTGVYICSPDVLGRFEDEFDYLDIAQDFITNCVAEEEEGLQTRIHAHLLPPNQYAARVLDWATYHAISNDLLRRWCYPMVPDNLSYYASSSSLPPQGQAQRKQQQQQPLLYAIRNYPNNWYKETVAPSKIARSATLTGPGMLGSRGQIEEHARIHGSVIGHHVQIQSHVVLQESHIWDNVTIEDSAQVIHSVLAKNVVIKKGTVVNKCVIGQGCIIGAGVVLPEYTRITLHQPENDTFGDHDDGWGHDDEDDNDEDEMLGNAGGTTSTSEHLATKSEADTLVVGTDGIGHVWQPSLEDDDDDQQESGDESDDDDEMKNMVDGFTNLQLQSIGTDLKGYYQKRLERQAEAPDDFSDDQIDQEAARMEDEAFTAYTEGAFTFADTPSAAPTVTPVVMGRQKGVDVVKELKEICMEFDDNGGTPLENLAIELNSYKFSQNASYADCTMAAILAIVDKMQITTETKDGKLVTAIKHKVEIWSPLLQKMCMGEAEEIAIIHGLERAATAGTPAAEKLSSGLSFRFFLQTLHDVEVLSEEAILAWAEERKSEPAKDTLVGRLFLLPSVQDFLEWLQDESDDSSSGEDSS
jgi:translation initiation factor eIF-2B subunit epsilon